MTIKDPVCNFGASGAGGIWQVTSQDKSDVTLAGCSDGTDPCCNARLAWSHAWNQGGALTVPKDYCTIREKDCGQIFSDCGGKTGKPWNVPSVTQKKAGQIIPNCSADFNPWYPNGGKDLLTEITIDQEPCWWGPFSIAAGGVAKEFFPGFYGWGGYFQHYLNSKAGGCDDSPQCGSSKNTNCNR
eukprot:UN02671